MAKQLTAPGCTYTIVARVDTTIYSPDQTWTLDVPAGQHEFIAETNEIIIPADAMMVRKSELLGKDLERVNVFGNGSGSLVTFVTRAVEQLVGKGNVKVFYMPDSQSGLPAGYKRVEYLESKGSQYIDTLVIGNSSYRIEATFQPTRQTITANTVNLFGCCEKYGSKQHAFVAIYDNANERATVFHRMDTNTSWDTVSVPYGKPCYFSITRGQAIIGETVKTVATTQFDHAQSMAFFSVKEAATFGAPCSGRLFSCAILDDAGNVVFEGIPALDETGAPCVYDKHSQKAFYNKGTGDFTYPTETATYSLRHTLPDWGKLTDTGLRRLYHVPVGYKDELYTYVIENGYKPIVEPEKPEEGSWAPRWTETADEIVLEWVETEPPTDEFGLSEENLTETK